MSEGVPGYGAIWPEQEAALKWWENHRLELMQAVSTERVRQEKRAEATEAEVQRLDKRNGELTSWLADCRRDLSLKDAECRRLRELLERGLTILRSYLKADPSDAIGDKETELYRQASHFEAEAYGALAPQARGREQAPPEAQGREEVGVAESRGVEKMRDRLLVHLAGYPGEAVGLSNLAVDVIAARLLSEKEEA